ncbi:hypothetical protein GCM10018790_14160 [Kitasatospora xanthocidica]|nr:hypothetical protein GCM10018790_14160 [Kitasatospora xanthocidica]
MAEQSEPSDAGGTAAAENPGASPRWAPPPAGTSPYGPPPTTGVAPVVPVAPPMPTQPPDPPDSPGRPRKWTPRRPPALVLALVLVLCLGLAGGAWWLWLRDPHPAKSLHVAAGTVQADLLSPDDVSGLAGTTVVAGPRTGEPPAELTAEPSSCAAAVGPATRTVYGNDWTAFLAATYEDAAGVGDYTVTQAVGLYPDTAKAGTAYRALTDGIEGCPTAVRTDQDGTTSTWNYSSDTTGPDAIAWTSRQYAGDGWSCYRQARLKGRALLQVALCQAGDGKAAAAAIADRFAAGVKG